MSLLAAERLKEHVDDEVPDLSVLFDAWRIRVFGVVLRPETLNPPSGFRSKSYPGPPSRGFKVTLKPATSKFPPEKPEPQGPVRNPTAEGLGFHLGKRGASCHPGTLGTERWSGT